jgi:dipeptide/tripeptide permease
MPEQKAIGWKFPREFWFANFMELCERAAYYGFFIVLTLYLTNIVGFSDTETGIVAGIFYALLYFFPPFAGAFSDKIGFKNGLILAFFLLTVGYSLLGMFHTKLLVILFLFIVLIGGAFIKPLISGTVAKTTTEDNRARGYSLFYWIVNIGSFGGKTLVPYIRQGIGLEYVNYFSAGMSFIAMLFAIFFFKIDNQTKQTKSLKEVINSLRRILATPRLLILILCISGFWIIQQQLYATMPKYVIRLLGDDAKPEWFANVNPAVIVLFVVLITNLMKKKKGINSMLVGMVLMPFAALAMSLSIPLQHAAGNSISIFGLISLHPLTLMMIIGIAIQGIAECFISPRYLEYFSLQAPKGEEGAYLGFSNLYTFFSALAGFTMSGFLLDAYCPDPRKLPAGLTEIERASYYSQANVIWYYFIAVGILAAISLFIFKYVTEKIDSKKG